MTKRILLGITAIMLTMAAGVAIASNENGNGNGKEMTRTSIMAGEEWTL